MRYPNIEEEVQLTRCKVCMEPYAYHYEAQLTYQEGIIPNYADLKSKFRPRHSVAEYELGEMKVKLGDRIKKPSKLYIELIDLNA